MGAKKTKTTKVPAFSREAIRSRLISHSKEFGKVIGTLPSELFSQSKAKASQKPEKKVPMPSATDKVSSKNKRYIQKINKARVSRGEPAIVIPEKKPKELSQDSDTDEANSSESEFEESESIDELESNPDSLESQDSEIEFVDEERSSSPKAVSENNGQTLEPDTKTKAEINSQDKISTSTKKDKDSNKADEINTNSSAISNMRFKPSNELSGSELKEALKAKIEGMRNKRKADDPSRIKKIAEKRIKKEKKVEKKKKPIVTEKVVVDESSIKPKEAKRKKTAESIKDTGDLAFSNFNFLEEKKKKGKTAPKVQLEMIENEKKELAELKKSNKEKAEVVIENKKWKKAMQLAAGEKIKDDPKLLKKTIKRQERKKSKTVKEWKERVSVVKKEKKQKQAKRQENIQSRIDAKKNKRLGIKPKASPKKHSSKKSSPSKKSKSK